MKDILDKIIEKKIKQNKSIYQKYIDGDSLTDQDLKQGLKDFRYMEKLLVSMGERFHFVYVELRHVINAFEGFQQARKRK